MTPFQQMYLGLGAKKKKTYLDDVFSTYLYKGTGSAQSINNGLNISGEGGMVWIKTRGEAYDHNLFDTVRGVGRGLQTNANSGELTLDTNKISAFNNNGFTLGNEATVNANTKNVCSWSFRKQKGFFDVVSWTGNGSSQNISHNLGSEPGCIMVKCTSEAQSWAVWHNKLADPTKYYLHLDTTDDNQSSTGIWNNTAPTSTQFTVGANDYSNKNSATYVAYVFAGGESVAATARSVDFDGSGDYLSFSSNSDFELGTGDFTIETWIKSPSMALSGTGYKRVFEYGHSYSNGMSLYCESDGVTVLSINAATILETSAGAMPEGQWTHCAIVKASGVLTLYINGKALKSASNTTNLDYSGGDINIGMSPAHSGSSWNGALSNFRIVKGTAVYTSSFRPPTEPLTNITNTKLLCCNDSSTTGKTVGPTITANGDPTASIDSPFDDPDGFKFGEGGDQNIIKCGSYIGNGAAAGPEIFVGFEPQWVLIKRTSGNEDWVQLDNMRGLISDGNDPSLRLNTNSAEGQASRNWMNLTPTGFKLKSNPTHTNGDGDSYIYIAIRRPDGYCSKPADAGTDVFAMDTGSGASAIPTFDSGFPVDFAFYRPPASTENWYTGGRLVGKQFLKLDTDVVEAQDHDQIWDSNKGWATSHTSSNQSWMWKRGQGFDVVTYKGNSSVQHIGHSLGRVPEMMWIKRRTGGSGDNWGVYHKGLDGGTNPQGEYLRLNQTNVETGDTAFWDNTLPTTTHFTVGNDTKVNNSSGDYMSMLFASVEKISKCGFYTGNGNTGQTITLGFQPRFLIIKNIDTAAAWEVLDTTRGWGSGNDNHIALDSASAQSADDFGAPTSTGFTLVNNYTSNNKDGDNFIYYAHA